MTPSCSNCLIGTLTPGIPDAPDFQERQHVLCRLRATRPGRPLEPKPLDHLCNSYVEDPHHEPQLVTGAKGKRYSLPMSPLGAGVLDPDCF